MPNKLLSNVMPTQDNTTTKLDKCQVNQEEVVLPLTAMSTLSEHWPWANTAFTCSVLGRRREPTIWKSSKHCSSANPFAALLACSHPKRICCIPMITLRRTSYSYPHLVAEVAASQPPYAPGELVFCVTLPDQRWYLGHHGGQWPSKGDAGS